MKVFLDSNVLVSAFATRGLAADLLRLVLADHQLVTSAIVMEEVERVLVAKIGLPRRDVAEIILFLGDYSTGIRPTEPSRAPISDPDDLWVLASAVAVGAEIFITGDSAVLAAAPQVRELQIMNPRRFWETQRGV